MVNVNLLEEKVGDDLYATFEYKGKGVLELKRIQAFQRGAFKRFWKETLIPFCEKNNIKVLTLTDSQLSDRDVWGEDYGFSGRIRRGTRNLYLELDETKRNNVNNSMIDNLLGSYIDGYFDEHYEFISKRYKNATVTKEEIKNILESRVKMGEK